MTSNIKHLISFLDKHYSMTGKLNSLPSYIDRNYRFTANGGDQYVIKIASAQTSSEEISLENAAMQHLKNKKLPFLTPCLIKSNTNEVMLDFVSPEDNEPSKIRVLSWLEGSLYSQSDRLNLDLQYSLGALVGQLVLALKDFNHPAAHRKFNWDLSQLLDLQGHLKYFHGNEFELLEKSFLEYKNSTYGQLQNLPKQIIHNDANDNNLVVLKNNDKEYCSGIFDFGDLVFTQRICDLAIAMTYALFNSESLFESAKIIVSGYRMHSDIEDKELSLLYFLIKARLIQSLLNSGKSFAKNPENKYLLTSVIPAWELLKKLDKITNHEFYNNII